MQVPTPNMQHAVMIEAVENHMPEVIIIDEIGTSLEAEAARTIAERGVQLIGTAHGNTLDNLVMNPTLSDLIGGIQTVTLGDEEARRRHTQKSILERKAPPTFDIVVEIQERDRVTVHPDVGQAIDAILHGQPQETEIRWLDENGEIRRDKVATAHALNKKEPAPKRETPRIYLFGINRAKLEEAAREKGIALELTTNLKESNLLLTAKNYYHRKPQKMRDAEISGIPIYAVKSNNLPQLRQCLDTIYGPHRDVPFNFAIEEAEKAIIQVREGKGPVELSPQNAYIRRLQHLLAERHSLASHSLGKEPKRRVQILKS